MPTTMQRLRVNDKEVAAKVIDGEAIIINLANGMYYSLDKTGAAAWVLISSAHNVDEAAAILADHYKMDKQRVADDLTRLAAELLEHKLVTIAKDQQAPAEPAALEMLNGQGYESPTLHAYNDMGDVLALDPPLPQLEEEPWSDETDAPKTA